MSGPTGKLCAKHGGDGNPADAYFYCDACARAGIDKCPCGGHGRYFGEALMCSVSCESCKASITKLGMKPSVRTLWNLGYRGFFDFDAVFDLPGTTEHV